MRDIVEWSGGDRSRFRAEVLPAYEPVVLRGAARDWPATRAALISDQTLVGYVGGRDRGRPVETFVGPPSIAGRFFYDSTLSGFNFERRPMSVSALLGQLLAHLADPAPPAIYAGALDVASVLPGFGAENRLPLVAETVAPRLWVGNATRVSAHYDLSHNIACVVAGRRRFTLFPPEQVANLYVGPLEFTVAGQPISLVDVEAPDFDRHPRFRQALETARTAELEPGDALYIPPLWWHHVHALAPLNLLVNYWWNESAPGAGSPFDCLVHGLLAIRGLPEPERRAWRAMFDHYIFGTGEDPAAHLSPESRGVLAPLDAALARKIRGFLLQALSRG